MDKKILITMLKEFCEVIRLAGTIPSGTLYASVMPLLSLDQYQNCIDVLKRTNLVIETSHHLLIWNGPTLTDEA